MLGSQTQKHMKASVNVNLGENLPPPQEIDVQCFPVHLSAALLPPP